MIKKHIFLIKITFLNTIFVRILATKEYLRNITVSVVEKYWGRVWRSIKRTSSNAVIPVSEGSRHMATTCGNFKSTFTRQKLPRAVFERSLSCRTLVLLTSSEKARSFIYIPRIFVIKLQSEMFFPFHQKFGWQSWRVKVSMLNILYYHNILLEFILCDFASLSQELR